MKIMTYLEKIYDSIYNCRLRLLKGLEDRGVHAEGSSNVLSEWGIISIINGYFISELNTMTIRQIMHLRKKPGSVIYNADYNTVNRCVTLMKFMKVRYQHTQLYKANIVRNASLYGWMNDGDTQWFHNIGVYVGPDNMPMITLNGGATWDMIDLSELYTTSDQIIRIKASISTNFEIIFFTILTENRVHIYALSSKSFGELDYTWLVQADLDTFTEFTVVQTPNSDVAELVLLNGGTDIVLDIYGMNEGETEPSLHHYRASVNAYGTIVSWKETKGYFANLENFRGQFIISKSFMSAYGLESVRANYTEFILTTDNNLHVIITSGATNTVPITTTFTYSPSSFGELTTECGVTNNVIYLRCTTALLVIQNNRNLTAFPFVQSFVMLDASYGIAVREEGYPYLYYNGTLTRLITSEFVDKMLLKVSPYAGQRTLIFLHKQGGEFVNKFDSTYTLNNTTWVCGRVKPMSLFRKVKRSNTFARSQIITNGKGSCASYYYNDDGVDGSMISYDSGANWMMSVMPDGITKPYIGIVYHDGYWLNIFANADNSTLVGKYAQIGKERCIDTDYNTALGPILKDIFTRYTDLFNDNIDIGYVPTISSYVYGNELRVHFTFINRYWGDEIAAYPNYENTLGVYSIPMESITDNTLEITMSPEDRLQYKWSNDQKLISYAYDTQNNQYLIYEDDVLVNTLSGNTYSISGIYISQEGYGIMDRNTNILHSYDLTGIMPNAFELNHAVVYLNKGDIIFDTLGCNDMLSRVGTALDDTTTVMKTSDAEVLIRGDYAGGTVSSSNVNNFHQGIAEYIDVNTGKITKYHGRLLDINSFDFMENELSSTNISEIFHTGDTLYGISYDGASTILHCFDKSNGFHSTQTTTLSNFKNPEISNRDYIVHNQMLYYLVNGGIARQSLVGSTVASIPSNADYLREFGGFIIGVSSNEIDVLAAGNEVYNAYTHGKIEDVCEWDTSLFTIVSITVGGLTKPFLVSFESVGDFMSSPYIFSEQTIFPDEYNSQLYEIRIDGDDSTAGLTGYRMQNCDSFLLIWNPNTHIIYRYDGALLSYWDNTLSSNVIDLRYEDGVVYIKDSDNKVYYSYDGLSFCRYYYGELLDNIAIDNMHGNLILVDNTNKKIYYNGILDMEGFSHEKSYGFYHMISRTVDQMVQMEHTGTILNQFSADLDKFAINNTYYGSDLSIESISTDKKSIYYDVSLLPETNYAIDLCYFDI